MRASTSRRCIRSARPPKADDWNLDNFLKAAEACNKAGFPFGIGLGTTSDSVDTAGALFNSFGAALVDANGKITVKSDPVRKALEYCVKLAKQYPADAPAWDDASNNKWLVSGRGAMIMNPPSAWAVAVRDAPQIAEQVWHHGMPSGPAGRYGPFLPFFWGIWSFSKNKPAAKSLLTHLSQESSAQKMVEASKGYDIPAFEKLITFKVWSEVGPPPGHAVSLSQPAQSSDPVDRGCACAAKDRRADLYAGRPDQDDRQAHAGRGDGEDARLG